MQNVFTFRICIPITVYPEHSLLASVEGFFTFLLACVYPEHSGFLILEC